MDMISAGVGAALGVGESFLQADLNRQAQHGAQDYNTEMFGKRYQMQVADLKAAGLNPMLAYMQSPGAGPSTSAYQVQKPNIAESAFAARLNTAQVANINQDTMKKASERANIDQDTLVKAGMPELMAAQVTQALSSAESASAMAKQIEATIPKIEAEIETLKTQQQKNISDTEVNNSIIKANGILNALRVAETILTGRKVIKAGQDIRITEPEAAASDTPIGKTAGIMEKVWSILNPLKHFSK